MLVDSIDINCDLGEGYDHGGTLADTQLFPYITSVNIACGFHAGTPLVMRRIAASAAEAGLSVGAHPSLPDKSGFGRRMMSVSAEDVYADTLYQVGALTAMTAASGTRVHHVKPHGALYHLVSHDAELASAFVQAVGDIDKRMTVFGPPNSRLLEQANDIGLPIAQEGFADRRYRADGTIAPRSEADSVHRDETAVVRQAVALAQGAPLTVNPNETVTIQVDTICLHSDTPGALHLVKTIYEALTSQGIHIRSVQGGER
jgi:5-oxoprolinase (ATP-hydrolysing) subunit A